MKIHRSEGWLYSMFQKVEMNQDKQDTFTKNIPAYVLETLERAEVIALEKHLRTCPVCQAELRSYQQIGNGLLTALPLNVPSRAVKGKLIARLEEKRLLSRPNTKRWGLGQFAVVVTMLALVMINIFSFLQIRDLRQQQTQLASQIEKNHTLLGLLTADTEIHPISSDALSGNLLLDRDKNLSYLLVWNLPNLPADSVYQIWLVGPDGERVDAGTFLSDADWPFTSTALVTMRDFTEFVGIEVTIEPSGGSDNPTGEQILNASY